MTLPSSHEHGSGQIHTPNYLDQYLAITQSSLSNFDSVESQPEELLSVNAQDPKWFTDFILYDSEDLESKAEVRSVLETSNSAKEELTSGMMETPLFTLSSKPDSESANARAAMNDNLYAWRDFTALEDSDLTVDLYFNMLNSQWSIPEPDIDLYTHSYFESSSGAESYQISPDCSISAQNNAVPKRPISRLPYLKCPTCTRSFPNEYRLCEHLRNSLDTVKFICNDCMRGFKLKRDLQRHRGVHKPKRITCSCGKTFARHDGFLRHRATQQISDNRHEAVEPSSNPTEEVDRKDGA